MPLNIKCLSFQMYLENHDRFERDVRAFMVGNGRPIHKLPLWENHSIGLFELFLAVHEFGGYDAVSFILFLFYLFLVCISCYFTLLKIRKQKSVCATFLMHCVAITFCMNFALHSGLDHIVPGLTFTAWVMYCETVSGPSLFSFVHF